MKYDAPIASAGKVTGQIITEAASVGHYRVWLYDAAGKNPQKIFEGSSDKPPNEFTLPAPEKILDRLIVVEGVLTGATSGISTAGVRVNLMQDGQPILPNGSVYESGQVHPQNGLSLQLSFHFVKQ